MSGNSILEAREQRWLSKLALIRTFASPVLSLALNIPGSDKNIPGTATAFDQLDRSLGALLLEQTTLGLLFEERAQSDDGPFSLRAVQGPPILLKKLAVHLEITHPLGRLADVDVLTTEGKPFSRADAGLPQRSCFLCDTPAVICHRRRAHSPEEIQQFITHLLSLSGNL